MRYLFVALAVMLAGCASGVSAPQSELHGSVSGGVMSKYIGALGHQLSEDPVSQSVVTVTAGSWEGKVVGFKGTNPREVTADEVDLWLSYKQPIGGWSLSVGAAYFAFDPVLDQEGDVVMPFVELGRDIWKSQDHAVGVSARLEDRIGKLPEREYEQDEMVGAALILKF